MLPILNQMFFLNKIWKKLYKISCDLHTIKTKVTFRSKNYVPEFLWFPSVVHPQWRPSRSVRLWLCKGSCFPTVICQSFSLLHTHTISVFIHLSVSLGTGAFNHSSSRHHINIKSIFKYPQVTSCVQKRFKKQCKSFKIELLTTPKSS
jgi:hypothetical protein